jgi:hypothetical protein
MKINTLSYLCLGLFISTLSLTAQSSLYPNEGDRSLNIRINPIFNYMGNFFNQSGNNSLDLSSADLLYRKYLSDGKVKRIRGNVSFRSTAMAGTNFFFPVVDIVQLGTQQDHSYFANVGVGREYRHSTNRFSFYSGWEFLSSVSFTYINFKYTYNDGDILPAPIFRSNFPRPVSTNRGLGLNIGFAGLFGGEYFVTKQISIGAEIILPATVGYQFQASSKFDVIDTSQNPLVLRVTENFTEKSPGSIVGSAFTNTTVAFRAGFIF